MTVDSSALVAVLCQEPGHLELLRNMHTARLIAVGAPNRYRDALVDQFLAEIHAMVVPFGRDHIAPFYDAFRRFGKGRHPARLNMGDCFTYAIAKVAGMPLLFVGEDFAQTDLPAA
jgi:ribonuclease VapC